MHLTHLITGLGVGGTPVMLAKLAEALHNQVRFTVIGMTSDEGSAAPIRALGVPVHTLGMNRGRPNPKALWKLCSLLRNDPPDLLQTWLYHADLMGLFAARTVARCPVVWNVRHATLTPGLDSRSTLFAAKASARLSRSGPAAIIVNSQTGLDVHVQAGYAAAKMKLIPNGFDLDRFRPSDAARAQLRAELGLSENTPLIGLMARYSSLKGQPTFINAMQRLHAHCPDAHFVLCGIDITPLNAQLKALIEGTSVPHHFHLLGERRDIHYVQAALDIAVSASTSEAFSNSIGEALACGVPVVTTNVGDSARLVGQAGKVVPIGNAPQMASACHEILSLPDTERHQLSHLARQHMQQNYELKTIANQYLHLWQSLQIQSTKQAA